MKGETSSLRSHPWVVIGIPALLSAAILSLVGWFGSQWASSITGQLQTGTEEREAARSERQLAREQNIKIVATLEAVAERLDIQDAKIANSRLDPWTGKDDAVRMSYSDRRLDLMEDRISKHDDELEALRMDHARTSARLDQVQRSIQPQPQS